jgi:hypothetical protein
VGGERVAFQKRLKKFIELWEIIVVKNAIQLPVSWKRTKLWKHSFLTSYIVYSMIYDPINYIEHWVRFIKALSADISLYSAWPHTTISRVSASIQAKEFKCQFAQGYHQVRFYNLNGRFDV